MIDNYNLIIKELQGLISGKNISDIINLETDNIYNKSAVSVILKKYIDKASLYNLDVLKEHNILLKFIPINQDYQCHEAMSFSNTSLYTILFEEWDSNDDLEVSSFKNQLSFNFLFIPIIKLKTKGIFNNYLDWKIGDFSFWMPSEKELVLIGIEWNNVKKIVLEGIELKKEKFGDSHRTTNNLPKQSESKFIHLRPHGKNSYDYDIPYLKHTNGAVEITKQSFWLNKKYINLLLDKYKWKMNLREE